MISCQNKETPHIWQFVWNCGPLLLKTWSYFFLSLLIQFPFQVPFQYCAGSNKNECSYYSDSFSNVTNSFERKFSPEITQFFFLKLFISLFLNRLFDWLVSFLNKHTTAKDSYSSIGLLDIYGFESFSFNSLEQLCINYANEKLQQHFVFHFLKSEQDEYAKEGLEWDFCHFDNNEACLDAIEGKISIFSLLNEVTLVPLQI